MTALLGACASHAARPEPFPTIASNRPSSNAASTPRTRETQYLGVPGELVVQTALTLLGRPYAPGGSGPERFDCSGLVSYVYAQSGIEVPRTVAAQFEVSEPVPADRVSAGDLLFFRISGDEPSHVAIAIGDGSFVHAPSERGRVRLERLDAAYWTARFQEARRVLR